MCVFVLHSDNTRPGPSVSLGVGGLTVQVRLHGRDELALLLQREVQVVLLVGGDVLEHLAHQLAVLWRVTQADFRSCDFFLFLKCVFFLSEITTTPLRYIPQLVGSLRLSIGR